MARGGFIAERYTVTTPSSDKPTRIREVIGGLLYTIFKASKRQQGDRSYWSLDTGFLYASGTPAILPLTYSQIMPNQAVVSEWEQITGLSATDTSVHAAFYKRTSSVPWVSTALVGKNGESLYIIVYNGCDSVTREDPLEDDNTYGLRAHCNNLKGCGGVIDVSKCYVPDGSGIMIWFKPSPATGGMTTAWNKPSPEYPDFLVDHASTFVGCGLTKGRTSAVTSSRTDTIIGTSLETHLYAVVKDGVLAFGEKFGTQLPRWGLLGKDLIEDLNGVLRAGFVCFNYGTADTGEPQYVDQNHWTFSDGSCSTEVDLTGTNGLNGISHAASLLPDERAGMFMVTMTTHNMCNRSAGLGIPISPVAIHVIPKVWSSISPANMLSGNGSSLVGFVRSDVLRHVFSQNIAAGETIDSGNYVALHNAGTSTTNTGFTNSARLILGWDPSNTVTIV